jgi:N-carbamoylputrescine amidase
MLIYPTAIGYDPCDVPAEQTRQCEAWVTIQRSHAIANGIPVISVNRVGFEADPSGAGAGAKFWGNSFVAGCQGELLAVADNDQEQVLIVDLDRQRSEEVRRIWPYFRDRRIDAYGDLVRRYRD